nr:uncharacterized protein LOC129282217 [Lytechinus pictus]
MAAEFVQSLVRSLVDLLPNGIRRSLDDRSDDGSARIEESPPSYDERNMPSIEDVLTELYYPFEDIAPYMTAQICDIINRRFKGDGSRFMLDFLLPCRELLLHLKEESWLQLKHKPREPSWPITHSNQILVHLSQLDWDQFHVGDFYVYVRYLGPKKVTLVLVACPETEGTLTEVPIPVEMFREFFSYHAPQRLLLGELKTKDTEDVTGLKTIVVATDTGIMRHLWPDVLKPQFELKRRSSWRKKKRKGEGGVTSGAITDTGTDQETKMPTRMASFSRTSSESKKKPLPPFRAPQSTLEVNFEVLHSEAIILTGSRDQGGRAVLEIKANNHVWCNPDVTLDDIVKLLAYVYSIPREEVRWRGLSIAVDARTAPKSDVERVTEALQLLHEHHPGAIDHVYLLIGHNSVLARVTRATNTQLLKTRLDYKVCIHG